MRDKKNGAVEGVLELDYLLDNFLLLSVVLVRAHTGKTVDDEGVHAVSAIGVLKTLQQVVDLGVEVVDVEPQVLRHPLHDFGAVLERRISGTCLLKHATQKVLR